MLQEAVRGVGGVVVVEVGSDATVNGPTARFAERFYNGSDEETSGIVPALLHALLMCRRGVCAGDVLGSVERELQPISQARSIISEGLVQIRNKRYGIVHQLKYN